MKKIVSLIILLSFVIMNSCVTTTPDLTQIYDSSTSNTSEGQPSTTSSTTSEEHKQTQTEDTYIPTAEESSTNVTDDTSSQSQTQSSRVEQTISNVPIIETIEPTFSTLSIKSSIPDADIYIDGKFAGKGVVSNKKVKYKEKHNVVIKKVGFKTDSFTLRPDGSFV